MADDPKNTFNITFRDMDHFYKVVSWMNTNVGHGSKIWTINKPVKSRLQRGNPVTSVVHVFIPDFDFEETSLFLALS